MERGKKSKTLLKIFITTLYLSTFTFGGGYVIVSLMKKKFVDEKHWIEQDEMLDLVAIAQSSPGPIAVNGSIAVGYKLCGIAGALVAIVGTIIPPFVIISIISYCYSAFRSNWMISQMLEGMQAGVAAVIASVTYDMGADIVKQKDDLEILIMIAAFVASYILEINVVFIVIVCGLVGVCRGQLEKRRGHGHKKTEDTSDGNPENHPDKGGWNNDLFAVVSKFLPDRTLQFRRRLCRHAAYTGTDSEDTWVDDHVRVHGFDHYIPDDSRPYSGQFGDICGTPGGWICRRGGCHARMYTSFMYHSHSHSKTLSEIPQTGHPSGTARRNKTCGCGDDRISGCFDICHGGLVWD